MRQLPILYVVLSSILMLGLSGTGFASESPASPSGRAFSDSTSFSDNGQAPIQEEFLPVEKAYQLQIDIAKKELTLLWNIAPGYYLYRDRFQLNASSGDKSIPLTSHFEDGKVKYDEYFEKDVETYYHSTEINVAFPENTKDFDFSITSQGCADAGLCYPPRKQYFHIDTQTGQATSISAPPASAINANINLSAADAQTENAMQAGANPPPTEFLPYILLLALLGGTILNLMPCVFPVLSIKAVSLASASQSPHTQHLHGWAYTLGVVVAFLVVASAMLIARAAGQSVGWGFQLQSPVFISFLAYLFFIMGLSMSGLIDFGSNIMGLGQSLTGGSGMRSSFFTGVLAAVIASPCTAPMMGTALGYAITQPPVVALSVFAALGFGMALPFLLLSYIPHLASYLPAPGAWMDTLKQGMAFPLYLASIWLLWILGHQLNSNAVALLSIGGVLIAFAFWLSKQKFSSSTGTKIVNLSAALAIVAAIAIPFRSSSPGNEDHWEPYTESKLSQLRNAGEPVLVNLTADWCITCLANEKIALGTDKVNTAIAIHGIHTLKGDWTNYNAEITQLLNRYGRSGVPLYLLFPARPGANAEVLPQLLTENLVLDAISRAKKTQTALN